MSPELVSVQKFKIIDDHVGWADLKKNDVLTCQGKGIIHVIIGHEQIKINLVS